MNYINYLKYSSVQYLYIINIVFIFTFKFCRSLSIRLNSTEAITEDKEKLEHNKECDILKEDIKNLNIKFDDIKVIRKSIIYLVIVK